MDDRHKLRDFLADLLRHKGDVDGFADSDLLMTSGRLQSIDTLELVVFLEEKYGVDFAERGFNQNELDSVDNIMALIGATEAEFFRKPTVCAEVGSQALVSLVPSPQGWLSDRGSSRRKTAHCRWFLLLTPESRILSFFI